MARGAARLAPAAALVLIWFTFVDHLRRSDLMVFLRAAGDVAHGINPYTPHTDPFLWGGSAYVYPFLTSYLFVPLTALPVSVADVLWFLLSAAALAGGCRAIGLRDPLTLTAVLLCAGSIRSFQVGSLNAALFLLAALMWRHRERTWVVAGCFTLLVGAKLFLAPLALWLLLTRSRRTTVTALTSAAAFLGLGFVLGPISVGEYVAETRELAAHEGYQGMSLLRLAHDFLPSTAAHLAPALLAAALLGAVVLRTRALRGRPVPEAGDRLLFCGTLVAALMLTPIFWSHYIVLGLLVPLLLRPARSTALLLLPLSWVVSRPDKTDPVLLTPGVLRMLLLFGLLAAVVLIGRRVEAPAAPGLAREAA